MRLINADKINFEEVFGGQSDFAKDLRKATQELIDRQPTVFDKEKVIEELKKAMSSAQLAQSLVGTDLVQCGGFSYGYYNGALTMMTVFVTGPVLLLSKTIPVKSIGIVTAASGQQGTIARDAKKAEKK